MAHAVFKVKGNEIASLNLTVPTVIGRASDCRVCVQDTLMSRHHLRFQPGEHDNWFVVDLSSANGTTVDDLRIERHELSDGDLIQAGHLTIIFFEDSLPQGGSGDRQNPLVIGEAALTAETTVAATLVLERSAKKTEVRTEPKVVTTRASQWDELAQTKEQRRAGAKKADEKPTSILTLLAAAAAGLALFGLAVYLTNFFAS